MDFTKFMNKFNEIERQLSPTSALRLSFDNISPETDEPDVNKRLWGVPVPPFVSDKVVSWIEEEFQEAPIYYNGNSVLKKVICFYIRSEKHFWRYRVCTRIMQHNCMTHLGQH